MTGSLRLPRHGQVLRALKISLVAGALYDFGFAALMVFAPELPSRLLELPLPGEAFYLWIQATFLAMLGSFYLYAAYDPMSYVGNIRIAIAGRFVGVGVFSLAALGRDDLWGLWVLAAGDLVFGFLHAVFFSGLRRAEVHG